MLKHQEFYQKFYPWKCDNIYWILQRMTPPIWEMYLVLLLILVLQKVTSPWQ